MSKSHKEYSIKSLIKDYSIETTPNVYEKYGGLKDFISNNNDVYVTYLPDEDPQRVIDTSKKIINEGLEAIPHLPARTMKDYKSLESYIGKLAEHSGCSKILVIGGGGKKIGEIDSSLEVLESELLSKFNFKQVGVAGHPEGNPDISKNELDEAIIKKNSFSKNADFKMYIATQFFFEAKSFESWERHIMSIGNNLQIHAGIPGPATLKTLIMYAKSCGIGNSLKFLSKQAMNLTKLATTRTPDKLITDLSDYIDANPKTKLAKVHLYAFGGMKKTSEWINSAIDKPLKISSNNEFTIVE